MQLRPRYDASPIIHLDGAPSAIGEPLVRHYRRFVDTLSAFTDEQWAHPSRCAGWSNRDVIVHLESATSFWGFSVAMAQKGEPTRFLATFDPVASPADLVAASRDVGAAEVLERFAAAVDGLADRLGALDDEGWNLVAEAPPGHVTVSTMAHHALWDSWIHERDLLVPLGLAAEAPEADEVLACLRYAAALSPAFAVNNGAVDRGALIVTATGPDAGFTVEIGDSVFVRDGVDGDADLRLDGDAVVLLEALSQRRPIEDATPAGVPDDSAWMVRGLAEVFDT